jgi:uncharacterized repeat protein (TIGR01451 family)
VIENNKTLVLTLTTGTNFTVSSLTTCGTSSAQSVSTITILDNDVDLKATKTVSNAAPIVGGAAFTYTVAFSNNTAQPTVAPLTAHNVTAAVADALPTDITFTSWTCAASGGATCPAASGTGAISGNAFLPAGASGAAGGSVTYTIQAVVSATATCGATRTNTATITVPAGFQEGTAAQSGFTTPTPGGTTDNTASVDIVVTCEADLAITKTNTPSSGVNDLPADTVTRGANTTYSLVVTNNGPSPVTGAVVQDPAVTGLTCISLTCSGTACPASPTVSALQSPGLTLGALAVGGAVSLSLTCTVN